MTGAVSWEALTWTVGIITAAGIGVAGFLLWVYRLVQAVDNKIEDASKEAALRAEAALAHAKVVEDEFRNYQIHVAEKFATKDGVTQAIGRMEAAVEKLTTQVHDAVERLTSRLDRILESRDRDRGPS